MRIDELQREPGVLGIADSSRTLKYCVLAIWLFDVRSIRLAIWRNTYIVEFLIRTGSCAIIKCRSGRERDIFELEFDDGVWDMGRPVFTLCVGPILAVACLSPCVVVVAVSESFHEGLTIDDPGTWTGDLDWEVWSRELWWQRQDHGCEGEQD